MSKMAPEGGRKQRLERELARSSGLRSVEYLKDHVRKQLKTLLQHDVGARLGSDPEDVHQMRVAIRRLRAFLRAARPMLAAAWAEHLRGELGWLGDVLGTVRDLDVLLAHLRDERDRLPSSERRGLRVVRGRLERDRRARWTAALVALRSVRYLVLLEQIEAAANAPVVTNPDVLLEEIAGAEFRKLRRAVRRAGREPSDAALHRIRIRTKHARHAAELAEPRTGKPVARFIRRAKDLQDLLGEHHDAVVAERWLRTLLVTHGDKRTTSVLGLLIGRQRKRRRRAKKAWPEAWRKVRKSGRASRTWRSKGLRRRARAAP